MKRAIAFCAGALAVFAATASAQVGERCGALNNRPVPLWGEFGTDLTIQDAFDAMVWAGPSMNCQRLQTQHSVFRPGFDRTVMFTYAGARYFGSVDKIGVYEVTDPSNKVLVWEGAGRLRGDQVLLTFLPNGDVLRNGQLVAQNFSSCFGVYKELYSASTLIGGDGDPTTLDWTLYSEDPLNVNGDGQMVMYRGYNSTMMYIPGATHIDPWMFADDEILVGIEAQLLNPPSGALPADRDYNEGVFFMQGVKVLPRSGFAVL